MMKLGKPIQLGGAALISSLLMMSTLSSKGVFAATAPAIQLQESIKNVTVGQNDTFTAKSTDITNPIYQFWVEQGHTWNLAQQWSSSDSYTLKNLQSGSALVTAYVKSKNTSQKATNITANGHEDTIAVFSNSNITTIGPTSITKGQQVQIAAKATNITPALYQFWIKTPAGLWEQSGAYNANNTFTFTATQTGVYDYIAYAKMPEAINNANGALNTNTQTILVKPNATNDLSPISIDGQTSGTGNLSNPAVVSNNKLVSISTQLTNSNDIALGNKAITFSISKTADTTSDLTLPIVKNANGTVITGTAGTQGENYTVLTNTNGIATLTISSSSTNPNNYTIQVTASHSGTSTTLNSTPIYLQFIAIPPITTTTTKNNPHNNRKKTAPSLTMTQGTISLSASSVPEQTAITISGTASNSSTSTGVVYITGAGLVNQPIAVTNGHYSFADPASKSLASGIFNIVLQNASDGVVLASTTLAVHSPSTTVPPITTTNTIPPAVQTTISSTTPVPTTSIGVDFVINGTVASHGTESLTSNQYRLSQGNISFTTIPTKLAAGTYKVLIFYYAKNGIWVINDPTYTMP